MICSSVNFDLFMSGPLLGPDSNIRWRSYRGSQYAYDGYHEFRILNLHHESNGPGISAGAVCIVIAYRDYRFFLGLAVTYSPTS